MASPAGMHPDMIGRLKTGRAKMSRPPKTDPSEQTFAKLVNVLGVFIEPGAPRAPAARSAFPAGPEGDAAFEAHLMRLGERIAAGMANLTPERVESRVKQKSAKHNKATIYRDGKRISWLDLRVVSCAGCARVLLAPSDECVRMHAGLCRSLAAKQLPPPVAGRICDRPVCAACHKAASRTSRRVPA